MGNGQFKFDHRLSILKKILTLNMNRLIIILVLIFSLFKAESQTQFLAKGKIEYERKINIHRQFDDMEFDDEWFKEYVSKMPRFHTTYFDLYFNDEQTIYKPGKEVQNPETWGVGPAKANVIVTDLNKKIAVRQKAVFEDTYLIQDSVRKINWKITDE